MENLALLSSNHAFVPLEIKLADDTTPGTFEGYGSVFNVEDDSGDLILPGAFKKNLRQKKSEGRTIPMYAMHGFRLGADPLPVGVWKSVEEDQKGLKCVGEIVAMDTEHGKRIYSLVKSGALGALSIGYRVSEGGAVFGSKVGEPRRTLKQVEIVEISLVDDPSNAKARVHSIKSARVDGALNDFAKRLRDGAPPEIKEFEEILRDAGVPRSMALKIASVGYAAAIRSDSGGEEASLALKRAASDLRSAAQSIISR
ncbi:peptidase U35 [Terrihabitans soli]|uniref:Peptidase U35 n=1 Tax=Terrihabitans soli TaxID=708113 RepID=A0A6S6QIH8_9HYPH|nr:HK97 family phage prohead protease [Terrihabitans soli]BCJ90034.1 peptidase U35 [Terrihabitans soli]